MVRPRNLCPHLGSSLQRNRSDTVLAIRYATKNFVINVSEFARLDNRIHYVQTCLHVQVKAGSKASSSIKHVVYASILDSDMPYVCAPCSKNSLLEGHHARVRRFLASLRASHRPSLVLSIFFRNDLRLATRALDVSLILPMSRSAAIGKQSGHDQGGHRRILGCTTTWISCVTGKPVIRI